MITINDFCKTEYGEKLYKLSFYAGMTCPNRDGTIDTRGCIFCSEGGSGDFAVDITRSEAMASDFVYQELLDSRISEAKDKVKAKFKGDKYIAYFQAFSNTYASYEYLRSVFMPVIKRDDIAVLSIATRPDCLDDKIYELLAELRKIKPVWIELGLQTANPTTAKYIRRGYENELYTMAVKRLHEIDVHVITHVILFLPGETKEDMLNSTRYVVDAGSDGIKLQLLHILKNTDLASEYLSYVNREEDDNDFIHIPTLEEYAQVLKECIAILPEKMVVHRMTGDAPKKLLIEPLWSADKKKVLNYIKKHM